MKYIKHTEQNTAFHAKLLIYTIRSQLTVPRSSELWTSKLEHSAANNNGNFRQRVEKNHTCIIISTHK